MKHRLLIIVATLVLLAGGFAFMNLAGGGSERPPQQTVSRSGGAATQVQVLEQQVRDQPSNSRLLLQLGALYLVRARESGDPSFYALADDAAQRALAIDDADANALVLAGEVALAQHDFARALNLGERARAVNPDVVATYGVLTDALVELGRYDDAVATSSRSTRPPTSQMPTSSRPKKNAPCRLAHRANSGGSITSNRGRRPAE